MLRVKILNRLGTRKGPFSMPVKSHLQTETSQLIDFSVYCHSICLISGHLIYPIRTSWGTFVIKSVSTIVTQEAIPLHRFGRLKPQREGGDSDIFLYSSKEGAWFKIKIETEINVPNVKSYWSSVVVHVHSDPSPIAGFLSRDPPQ